MEDNICRQYLNEQNIDLVHFWCRCDDLAEKVKIWAYEQGINAKMMMIAAETGKLFPMLCEPKEENIVSWDYHIVIKVKNKIHDAWFPYILSTKQYIKKNFGHQSNISIFEYVI